MSAAGRARRVRAELAESRDRIIAETGFAPRFLCTPYCQQNDETDWLCREANLRQMNVARYNFGSNNCDRVAALVEELTAKGMRRADFLHHGIAANEHGGWCPFLTRESFARHLDAIAALEREGRVIVTDYDGAASDCRLTAGAWPHHGVVALSFDDRSFADWRRALPLFAQYDARTTFCVCGEITDEAIAFMRQALAAGHEIALHGLRHRDADREIAARGVEAYWQVEMEPQLAACHTNGIPVRSFAYPNCRRSPETDAAFLAKGFTRLRGRLDGIANPQPHDPKGERLADWKLLVSHDPSFVPAADCLTRPLLPNVILGENYHTRLNDILASCRRAGSRAECLSLVSHGISPGARGINMKTEWLERMLSSARRLGVVVRGVR